MTVGLWDSGADISDDGLYRYRLWRTWGSGPSMVWIMLNPSTADGDQDDRTIRRCMGFARREGYAGIEVINLYALRCTRPAHLLDHPDPEGPDNLDAWRDTLGDPNGLLVVAAWGAHIHDRDLPVSKAWVDRREEARGWYCLGHTKHGHPCHPLYLADGTPLEPLL